jgi:MSHA pilin protein MshA
MKKQQSGFTLIELVMVIVILGILAAFALPKFADLSGDAELAAAKGGLGAVKSAAGIYHAAYLAAGSPAGGATIEATQYAHVQGYPESADIGTLSNLDGFTLADAGTVATITLTGSTCEFTYTEAAANAAPTYSAVTGC